MRKHETVEYVRPDFTSDIDLDAHPQVPPVGTLAFRAFIETEEWKGICHEQALADDKERDKVLQYEEFLRQTPVLMLGASVYLDPKIWSRDWREKLPIDDPMRMDYEESIYGKTEAELAAEDLEGLRILHEASIRVPIEKLV